jgi:hypothetical protein
VFKFKFALVVPGPAFPMTHDALWIEVPSPWPGPGRFLLGLILWISIELTNP